MTINERVLFRNLDSLSGRGEIYSHTTVYEAPKGFEKYEPYQIALIKLEEGALITAQLTDVGEENIEIGTPVEMVTRELKENGDRGMKVYGPKFRPRLISET